MEEKLRVGQAITLANASQHFDVPGITEIELCLSREGVLPGFRSLTEIQAAGGVLIEGETRLLGDFSEAHRELELGSHRGLSLVHLARSVTLIDQQELIDHLRCLVGRHPLAEVAAWLEKSETDLRGHIARRKPPLGRVIVGLNPRDLYLNFAQVWSLKTDQPLRNVETTIYVPYGKWLLSPEDWPAHTRLTTHEAALAVWGRAYGKMPETAKKRDAFDAWKDTISTYCEAAFATEERAPRRQNHWFLQSRHLERIMHAAAQAANGTNSVNGSANGGRRKDPPLVLPPEMVEAWQGRKSVKSPLLQKRLNITDRQLRHWANNGWIPGLPPLSKLHRTSDKAILIPAGVVVGLTIFANCYHKLLLLYSSTPTFWPGLAVALKFLGVEAGEDNIIDFATGLHPPEEVARVLEKLGHKEISADAKTPGLGHVLWIKGEPHLSSPQIALLDRWLAGHPTTSRYPTTVVDVAEIATHHISGLRGPQRDDFLREVVPPRLRGIYPAQAEVLALSGTDAAIDWSLTLLADMLDRPPIGSHYFFRPTEAPLVAGVVTYALASYSPTWKAHAPRLSKSERAGLEKIGINPQYLLLKLWLTQRLGEFDPARHLNEEEKSAWMNWLLKKGIPDPRLLRDDSLVGFLHSPWQEVTGKRDHSQCLRYGLAATAEIKIEGNDAPWLGWRTFVGHEATHFDYWDYLCMARDVPRLGSLEGALAGKKGITDATLMEIAEVTFYRSDRDSIALLLRELLTEQKDKGPKGHLAVAQFVRTHTTDVKNAFEAQDIYLAQVADLLGAAQLAGVSLTDLQKRTADGQIPLKSVEAYTHGQLPTPSSSLHTVLCHTSALMTNPLHHLSRPQRITLAQSTEAWRTAIRGLKRSCAALP